MFSLIIIDDEPGFAKGFADTFDWQQYGFSLSGIFSDSEKAVEFLENNRVDLVFTDIKMPGYTGIDIAKLCLEMENPPYVVILSAYAEFEYAKQAMQYKVYDFIVKPFSFTNVENVLKKIYGALDSKYTQNLFDSNMEMLRQQAVFSDLVLNNIDNADTLKEKLSSIGLPPFIVNNRCAKIKITIHNFNEYLTNTWHHGENKLYNAISYLAASKNNLYCSLFASVGDTFEILAIEKSGSFDEKINLYLDELKNNLEQLLSIQITVSIQNVNSLSDFIPQTSSADNDLSVNDSIVKQSMDFIKNNYKTDISLDDAAKNVSLSRIYFCSYFKRVTGENFFDVLNRFRIEKAKELLLTDDIKIIAIAEAVGYKSTPYFYKTFSKFTNLTPAEYRSRFRKEKS